jgi:hypothetical protein
VSATEQSVSEVISSRAGRQPAPVERISVVEQRSRALRENPVAPTFDGEHLRKIHAHLFAGEAGAGKYRADDLAPDGTSLAGRTARATEISRREAQIFGALRGSGLLDGGRKDDVVHGLADHLAAIRELNPYHGTMDVLTVYAEQVAKRSGYALDMLKVDPELRQLPSGQEDPRRYTLRLRNELRRWSAPRASLAFADAMRTGDRETALKEAPALEAAFERVDWARLSMQQDPESDAARRRYDHVVDTIQGVLARGDAYPDRGLGHALDRQLGSNLSPTP